MCSHISKLLKEIGKPLDTLENVASNDFILLQAPVKLTTLRRFKLTSAGRFKLTTSGRSKLTT
jgi:hypothetical protein